jgi:hypothetical protein
MPISGDKSPYHQEPAGAGARRKRRIAQDRSREVGFQERSGTINALVSANARSESIVGDT